VPYEATWPQPDLSVVNDSNRDQLAAASELVDFNKADFAGAYLPYSQWFFEPTTWHRS